MRKASYLPAAIVVATAIAGCGGSSVSSTTTTAVKSPVVSALSTNLASTGLLEVSYLTGAGRAVGDTLQARISLSDFTDDQGNTVRADIIDPLNLTVSAYAGPTTIRDSTTFGPSTNATVPSTNSNSRLFHGFVLDIAGLRLTSGANVFDIPTNAVFMGTAGMSSDSITAGAIGTSIFTPQTYPAYIRSFPGRVTTTTVRFDPNVWGVNTQVYSDPNTTLSYGPSNPRGIFEDAAFRAINFTTDTGGNFFQGVISDFLSFDISAMADSAKPQLSTTEAGTVIAQRVFFSGDNYGIAGAGTSGGFFQLTSNIATNQYVHGTFSTNTTVGNYTAPSGLSVTLPGTYALDQIDPSDPSFLRRIVSLQGMFREYSQMINAKTSIVAITFPSSLDNSVQDLVVVNRSATSGKIVDFYYGWIDTEARQVFLYPINTLVNAVQGTASYTGTVNPQNLYSASGAVTSDQTAVRSGVFSLSSAIPLSNGDGTTTNYSGGTYYVYRK